MNEGMRGFRHSGKQVFDGNQHFADAATVVGAMLIVAALNFRNHRPVARDHDVICSRCLNLLPADGNEPCIPRTPRCTETPDMFGGGGSDDDHGTKVPVVQRASGA